MRAESILTLLAMLSIGAVVVMGTEFVTDDSNSPRKAVADGREWRAFLLLICLLRS